ncbi:MAG: DoxX family protein [Acidobacteriota bacterium]
MSSSWQQTSAQKHLLAVRLVAAVPLVGIGAQHLLGTAPILPILEGAGFPVPTILEWLAPTVEVIAGLLLALGWHARPGALLAVFSMFCALYAHYAHDWGSEPALVLPLAVLLTSLQILLTGAGAFSVDLAQSTQRKR